LYLLWDGIWLWMDTVYWAYFRVDTCISLYRRNIFKAIILLSFYSLGLAIPFILSGYLMQRFLIFSKNFKKNINLVTKGGGVILLITGVLILTNQLQILGYYILNYLPFLQNFG